MVILCFTYAHFPGKIAHRTIGMLIGLDGKPLAYRRGDPSVFYFV